MFYTWNGKKSPTFIRRLVPVIAALGLAVSPTAASTVIPPTFSELISNASEVFVGRVESRESRWLTLHGRLAIFTDVTFRVEESLKGVHQQRTTLRFRGGTVGDVTLSVSDMPQFEVGDRDLIFVENRDAVSPLLGFMHGRFKIQRDPSTGTDRVATHDGRPLASTASLGRASADSQTAGPQAAAPPAGARGLSLSEFRAEIRTRLRPGVGR